MTCLNPATVRTVRKWKNVGKVKNNKNIVVNEEFMKNRHHTVTAHTLHTQHFLLRGSRLLCDEKCVLFETTVRHSRASCLIRTRRGLIFHAYIFFSTLPLHFVLLTVMNNHLIQAQQDGLVDWQYKVICNRAIELHTHQPNTALVVCAGPLVNDAWMVRV